MQASADGGVVTMTTKSCNNGAHKIVSMNFSGYIVNVIIFIEWLLYCMLFTNRVTVRVRISVWLLSGYANVFILLSVVIATLLPIVTFIALNARQFSELKAEVHLYSYNVFDLSIGYTKIKMRKSRYHLTYGQQAEALM